MFIYPLSTFKNKYPENIVKVSRNLVVNLLHFFDEESLHTFYYCSRLQCIVLLYVLIIVRNIYYPNPNYSAVAICDGCGAVPVRSSLPACARTLPQQHVAHASGYRTADGIQRQRTVPRMRAGWGHAACVEDCPPRS